MNVAGHHEPCARPLVSRKPCRPAGRDGPGVEHRERAGGRKKVTRHTPETDGPATGCGQLLAREIKAGLAHQPQARGDLPPGLGRMAQAGEAFREEGPQTFNRVIKANSNICFNNKRRLCCLYKRNC